MTATITDSRLEEMMLGQAACQINHHAEPIFECTVEVTHRYRVVCTGTDKMACDGVVARLVYTVSRGDLCAHCGSRVADCWSVVPV